jgi:hypothetical protein
VTLTVVEQKKDYFYDDKLPLAIYREIAAHLESINGVTTGTIAQDSLEFDYAQSQLKGLWIEYPQDLDIVSQEQIKAILAYYDLN